jgi:hypothetical protein
MHTHD